MQVSEFLVVAGLSGIILPCPLLGQNNEINSWNPTVVRDGKVTVNFGDLVIQVKPPQGREYIVNTQPIYERWENVDDVTYWESIYGSMDNIPAFEDLPDIPGETVVLKLVKESDEEDPEEKPIEITNKHQSEVYIKNSKPEITTINLNSDRCEKINPLFPELKTWKRQKREISVSQEEEADAEEAFGANSNQKRSSRPLSLRKYYPGKARLKSNWRSDYLFNNYGRKTFHPYECERKIPVYFVDDCTNGHGITGVVTSTKFVDSAINAVESVNSGIAKTDQVVTSTIVNGARQLAQPTRHVIDLSQPATQAVALGSVNNGKANCRKEGIAVTTNIDSCLEVVGNSVLDTKSGIINVGTDTGVPVGITASLDAETKTTVDTVVGSGLDNDGTVGAEIVPNAVAESNVAITVDKNVPERIVVPENKRKVDLEKAEIVKETLGAEDIDEETLGAEESVGKTFGAKEITGDTSVPEEIVGETLVPEEIVGGTLVPQEIVGETLVPEEIIDDATAVKTPLAETELTISSQLAGELDVVPGTKTSTGSALEVKAESTLHTTHNAEISTGSKTKVKVVKYKNEADRPISINPDLSHECAGYSEDDHDREFCPRRRYYDEIENEQEYRRRYLDRSRYRFNSQHPYGRFRSEIHADAEIHKILDAGIGVSSNHGSVSSAATTSADLNANLDINSGHRAGNLYAGKKSSLDLDSHGNIGRNEFPVLKKNQIYGDFNGNEDVCECEDSEEYREYRRRYPSGRFHHYNHGLFNSRTHANAGIYPLLNSGINVKDGLYGDRLNSGLHAFSGIRSSLDTGVDSNENTAGKYSRLNGKSSGQDISTEYDDYDGEEEYERFSPNRYRDSPRYVYSGIHAASSFPSTGVSWNADSAGNLQASAKSSLNLDSHLDIDTTSAVNSANSRHFPDAINSAIRAGAGVHTSLDTDINTAAHLHSGIKSSLAIDSHLDVGTRTNDDSGAAPKSEIIGDVNGPDRELGEKIREAACRGNADFRKHDTCPYIKFDPFYICDNCRRRLHNGRFCPNCGGMNDYVFGEQPFLSSGPIYHFDGLKQNSKRTVDSSEDIELHPKTKCGLKHYINLNTNCSDEAFQQNPDCRNLDYNLQMPRDGKPLSLGIVRAHLSHGHDIALDMHDRARSLVAGGLHPYSHTASMLHFFNSKVSDDIVKLKEESELTLFGMKFLQHKLSQDHNITPNNFLEFLNHHGFRVTGDRICRGRQKRCGGYDKFRSLDGSCNNVAHPTWGQSNRAFNRILPARYSDGIHGMPVSVTGAELPNPRELSVRLYSRSAKLDPELTLAVMQWGQILAHDLGRQVMDQTTSGGIECCADNGKLHLPKSLQHHSCAPITISPRDKFYSIHGQRCMNFVRAMTVCSKDCTLEPANQLNVATSFLDCSSVYGPDKATSDELREFTGGRMKVEFRSGRWMLPTTTNQSSFCDIWTSDDVCYRSGDPRNNQNPQLVILQTMLVREHNRIADGLKALNLAWNDERIFQESRRIVIAEYQHITYNEWLPLLLGKKYVKKHGLSRIEPAMSSAYNERVNPTTIIGFTSGSFRSLHSMIDGDIGLCNVGGEFIDNLRLSDHFFRPKVIERGNNFEHLLRGLASQRMQAQDMNLHGELTEYLFCSHNDYGMDLAAIDIQRGRDHGVPGYNAYRKICRLEPASDFDDLSKEISWENIKKLQRNYAHVDDIDLIVGATMENRAAGSLFGPTNRCLIGEQFYRSRVGDRYFYDNANLPHSFTPEQFHEITKATLSRLMCDMGGAVDMLQRNAFRAISSKNPLVYCNDLPKLDLTLWME